MNSFKNPLTPLIADPKGIDKPIQDIQQALAALGWLEKSFGRTWQAYEKIDGKEVIYPETWQGEKMDLLNVMPNDNLKAQSFITINEPSEILNFRPGQYSRFRTMINVIVWFNLDQIFETVDYRHTELLKSTMMTALSTMLFDGNGAIKVSRIWEQAENVFKGFTIDRVKRQELVHPYGGFRFECELTYLEDCPPAALPVT
jgi:hypothetical protein